MSLNNGACDCGGRATVRGKCSRCYMREWQASRPGYDSAKGQYKRAKRRGVHAEFVSPEELRELFFQQGAECARCFVPLAWSMTDAGAKKHLDHIVPLARGGSHTVENLQYLCEECNLAKGAGD